MAIMIVCSVRDVVASTFGRPFYAPNTASARRSLSIQINQRDADPNDVLVSHPGDFELYELGSFDDQSAQFELYPQPQLVVRCGDLVDQVVPSAG